MIRTTEANTEFMKLPAKIRAKFQDVGDLLNWIQKPENANEACDLGILPETERPKPAPKEPKKAVPNV
jgi:hypothetical protein